MNDKAQPFSFSQFVPGFDFLANLTKLGASAGDAKAHDLGGMPGLSNWVAPTLSVEEVDKRIKELKTVQFWLEQNLHALKATVQALEVQKMTLSTLQGMNLRMDDLAKAFGQAGAGATPEAAPAAKASAAPKAESADASASSPSQHGGGDVAKGLIDPVQWWGALSQQFQQIAHTALQESANLKMPGAASAAGGEGRSAPAAKSASKSTPSSASDTAPAARKASAKRAPAKKSSAPRRRNPPTAGR